MSNTEPSNFDGMNDQDLDDEGQPKESPKQLREAAERGREASKEAEKLRRENAFLKAGVDISTDLGELLFDSYKGELTVEAIQAKAESVGALKKLDEAPNDQVPPEGDQTDPNQTRERNDLAGDSQPPGTTPDADPRIEGLEAARASMAKGVGREDAGAQFMNRIIDAAAKGDDRVIYDPDRDRGQVG